MRIAVDTGGTFTDLIVEEEGGHRHVFKSATTPDDPAIGIFRALREAASKQGVSLEALLGSTTTFIHATTRAINAVLTGKTATTAFLATRGHRDILVFREGGRIEIFNFSVEYPDPYVPRSLTFEVPERIAHDGSIVEPLDETALLTILERLKVQEIEAVSVCLLFSTVNPVHENRVGALIEEHLPGVPFTLSHRVNPTLREYRRASSAAIDASLKPLMSRYLNGLMEGLAEAGFQGRFLMVTSQGGVKDGSFVADAPIHAINSGPAMAPVGGRHFARTECASQTAIIADAGGTSFDVSLVRDGRIPVTRETWLGETYRGHMTGFPSIDVRSIGAGGGSIAWVDDGGMLHVGPESAGADPGPACYLNGGERATVTDAALVIGLLDPDFFLGGRMRLDMDAARRAIELDAAHPLGLDIEPAALAILEVVTENMVQAIEGITIHQGVDPRGSVLIAGGGAAGLNAVAMARRLGCPQIVVPAVGAVLSAAGGLMADLADDYSATLTTTSARFDRDAVNAVLADLRARSEAFVRDNGAGAVSHEITYFAEARYSHQVWDIEVPLCKPHFGTDADLETLAADFHDTHEAIFAVRDPDSDIEFIHWHARVRCRLHSSDQSDVDLPGGRPPQRRSVLLPGHGAVDASVIEFGLIGTDDVLEGPAIVESPFTSVAIDPDAVFRRGPAGSLLIKVEGTMDESAARLAARRW